jgi:hypothetical protein
MSKLGKAAAAAAAAGTLINGFLDWSGGKVQAVRLGALRVWDRTRWNERPRIKRWKARRAARRDAR